MSLTRRWSLLTAVLIVGILAASWFLVVSPKRSEAADIRSQATKQQASNDALVQQLSLLKAQSLDLPKQQAELAVFRKQIPDNPALPTLIRDLTAAGQKAGVELTSMAPGTPSPATFDVPAPVAAPVAPPTDPAADGTTDSTASTAVAPAPPVPAAAALYLLPLKLEVSGSYFEIEQFLNKLEGLKRSFLVTGFTLSSGAADESGAGTTASTSSTTAAGELSLSLDGRVFLSPNVASTATTTSNPAAAPATAQAT